MGFEALLLGKECVCFGMPFYAGWGLTDDRIKCSRRKRKLTVNQLFAGAYILYTRYYNPYLDKESDIIDTLYSIKKQRDIEAVNSPVFLPAASRLAGKFREQAISVSRKILARIK
jgi:capsular polysaccharide export protein